MKFSTACLAATAIVAMSAPAFAQTEAPAPMSPPAATPMTAETQPAPAEPPVSTTGPVLSNAAPVAQVETNAAPGTRQAASAAAAAAAASRELPQVLPTTGDGATITTILTNICMPMVRGGDIVALAKQYKIKADRRSGFYNVPLEGKGNMVSILPPGSNNKNVCELRVRYAIGADQPIVDALSIWRFLHKPQMVLRRNDIANYGDVERVTTTWDNFANQMIDGNMFGLALSQINKLDGSPSVDPKFDEAIIQYTIRAATQPVVDANGQAMAPGTVPTPAAPAPAPATPEATVAPAAPVAADGAVTPPAAPAAAPAQ